VRASGGGTVACPVLRRLSLWWLDCRKLPFPGIVPQDKGDNQMRLGFLGTGVITEAIIHGVRASDLSVASIHVSPRNAEVAQRLARVAGVVVGADNQAVVDAADMIILAVRPQDGGAVIAPLDFRPGQQVVSLLAATDIDTIAAWIGMPLEITRAIPLPFIAQRQSVTAIYPPNAAVAAFFDALGTAVQARSKRDFDLMATASAMMATYYGILDTTAHWLEEKGMDQTQARAYLAPLFVSLSEFAAHAPDRSFDDIRGDFSTKGGLNEQVNEDFKRLGGSDALVAALDRVFLRIEQG
jgi:pyrroline-5-carboxylate reductase